MEKRKHTKYLADNTKVVNYDIYLSEMDKQQRLIYLDNYKGVHTFISNIPNIFTLSTSDKYKNLVPGNIIYDTPKRLVKKNNLTKDMTYKI